MKAVQIYRPGSPKELVVEDVDYPKTHKNSAIVKIAAAGVNYIDIYHRKGVYPIKLPHILGTEASGIIVETMSNDFGFKSGDRVAFFNLLGAYSEYINIPIDKLVKVPESIDLDIAAAGLLQGLTALILSHEVYKVKPNDFCLVHAGAGGVGQMLIQILKYIGAHVTATVSTLDKLKKVQSIGADEVIIYTKEDFPKRVKQITNNLGMQVVFDSVGKDTFTGSIKSLATKGIMILYGQSSGPAPNVDPLILLNQGSIFLTRPSIFHYVDTPDKLRETANMLFHYINMGIIKVNIDRKYPFEKASEAHERLEGRKSIGKILLKP